MSNRNYSNIGDYKLIIDGGKLKIQSETGNPTPVEINQRNDDPAAIAFTFQNAMSGFLGVDNGTLRYGNDSSMPFEVFHQDRLPRLIGEVDLSGAEDFLGPRANNVLYVSENGADANSGETLATSKRTIKSALDKANQLQEQAINQGKSRPPITIFVKSGRYVENNPMIVNRNVTIWGDNLRSTFVSPRTRPFQTKANFSELEAIDPDPTVANPGGFTGASDALLAARSTLQDDVVVYVNTLPGPEVSDKCARDVGFIVDAVAEDLVEGGKAKTEIAALAYFRQGDSVLDDDKRIQIIAALDFLVDEINDLLSGFTGNGQEVAVALASAVRDTIDSPVDFVKKAVVEATISGGEIVSVDIIDGGFGFREDPRPSVLFDTVTNVGEFLEAAELLTVNREFVKAEVGAFVESNYPSLLDPTQLELCKRDAGFILDAIVLDLINGGTANSIEAALTYFNNAVSILPGAQVTPTLAAISFIGTLSESIIRKQSVTPLNTDGVEQVIIFVTTPDPGAVDTIIGGLIDGINDTIENPVFPAKFLVVDILREIPGVENNTPASIEFDVVNNVLVAAEIIDGGSNLPNGTVDISLEIPHPDDGYDLFYVNNGAYMAGMTFNNLSGKAAAAAFDPLRRDPLTTSDEARGFITTSPYVQNCSCINVNEEGGIGLKIDGKKVRGLRSMVSDAFTQINTAGTGVYLLNRGYAQLVSIFTVSTNIGILAESGGFCSVANSNSSFGNFGLVSRGVSELLASGTVDGDGSPIPTFETVIKVDGLLRRPAFGDAVLFNYTYDGSVVGNIVTFSDFNATSTDDERIEVFNNGELLKQFQYEITNRGPVTIEVTDGGVTLGTVTARLRKYYTVDNSTELDNGSATLTLDLGVTQEIPDGVTIEFYQRSLITSSAHTFEYIGSGTNFLEATPVSGGIPIRENEIVQDIDFGGQVFFTSTDEKGDFKIGPELMINRNTGTITGEAFDRSLFAVLTPYILSLES